MLHRHMGRGMHRPRGGRPRPLLCHPLNDGKGMFCCPMNHTFFRVWKRRNLGSILNNKTPESIADLGKTMDEDTVMVLFFSACSIAIGIAALIKER